jgi:gamma-glutamylcyclotransferase (GGCT)/AIG2-like uncharacterized protein YtfP
VTNALFVYGTLMRGEPSAHLVARARSIGPAFVRGRLYVLSEGYPALIAASTEERVFGELLAFDDLARELAALDAYEGCDPEHPERSLFHRVVVDAQPEAAPAVRAHVYVMPADREPLLSTRGAVRISDGRWRSELYGLRRDR